jgi:AcrR family transcriptional regulator
MTSRPYSSPLRDRQAQQTRDHLLDTLTQLLETNRADEITTRELARAADVAERTVYRHFPDREALLAGLTDRLGVMLGRPPRPIGSVDDFSRAAIELMAMLDQYRPVARAEALLNADPRRFSPETRSNTDHFLEIVRQSFPDLEERELIGVTAVVRCLLSSQAWLRMREEFDLAGTESGPIVGWVCDLVFDALRRGERPPIRANASDAAPTAPKKATPARAKR